MRYQRSILLPLFLVTSIVLAALLFCSASPVTSQTPLNANIGGPSRQATQLLPRPTPTPIPVAKVPKLQLTVGPTALITLRNAAGGRPVSVKGGLYDIVVRDRSETPVDEETRERDA